ncbi:hypothetical protein JKF63_05409 [Porcisia hertigi]|uniref:TEP-1 C-terminal beta-propeller domain-containing protein n=1 Tax=Porcisia hertigi TaxID=2761500 RepID=A0A836IMR2_9TRYP|nr:hypothetical protein JKF63_05409 [Porcisia hertigi]
MASASADLNVMLLPQLPQALHQSSMSFTRSADLYPTQESLSDISAALSIVSTPMHTSHHSSSISCACSSEGPCGFMSRTFCKDENSKAQQLQASVQMETDLFIYDDIVISKNEARIKHWHLAGRKPRSANTELGRDNETSECSGYGKRMNGVGHRFFSFNDFDVCVDEMDIIPMSGTTAGSASTPHREASPVGSPNENLRCITVTSTVAERPNTVAHFLEQCRLAQPKANRPLRGFHTSPYLGHATRIKCLALSPSETDLVSCSNEDASVTLKNLQLNSEVGIFTGHQDAVINAIFSSDGKYLATASKDKTMILWDVMTAKRLLTFAHPKVVICCCFSPDSKYIMSGCQDRVCRLWDTKRGREWLRYAGHKGIIIAMAFSPNGNDLCSASADKSLRVWSTTTAKTRLQLIGHVGIVLSCSYTSDGQYIISNDESVLRVWSAEDGSCTLSVSPLDVAGYTRLHHRVPRLSWTLSSAAPGSFTQLIVVACNNHFVYLLDIRTGREVTSFFCKASVYCLTVGSYEKVACGDSFGNIYMLSLL